MWSGSATTTGTSGGHLGKSLRALQSSVSVWLMLQQTVAAVLAWLIATEVIGHAEPFFAPMAAVIALNATLGERGINALRMLLGVGVGIAVGELTITLLGRGYWPLAIATFTAMAVARILNANRIVIAQAAASAILTVVALRGGELGVDRLVDALVGGGTALAFTQVLFAPEPVRLLRRAEAAGLAAMAEILERTARALEHDDVAMAERTLRRMHTVRNQLIEVERTMLASARVHRHTVTWRQSSRAAALQEENARARRLDLLGSSCLMLARTSLSPSPIKTQALVPGIRALAIAIGDLATKLDDRDAHRRAAARALQLARAWFRGDPHPTSSLVAATMLLEIAAVDFMAFLGIEHEEAIAAIQQAPEALDLSAEAP